MNQFLIKFKSWYITVVIIFVIGIIISIVLVTNRQGKNGGTKREVTRLPPQETSMFAMPLGSNNAHVSDLQETDVWLKDLGVAWISDHLPRRSIEKSRGQYDFNRIDGLLQEYGAEAKMNAWFIINIESKLKFNDGQEIPDTDKFVPNGPSSYAAYEEFLEALVIYVNEKVPGWKARLWSIDNEHAALYLPAFCGARTKDKNTECAKKAAEAYAELVERSYHIIKRLDPQAKIVFGGPASGSPREDYDLYYKQALIALRAKHPSGYFDFFDYHNFNLYQDYRNNMEGLGIEYFRELLADTGLGEKPIIIKAGGTHSGKDELSKNKRLHILQTESQQAEHEFKRLVYHIANGAALILRDTGKEDLDLHTTFSYHGLRYNGIPQTCDPAKEQPCPDPGDGIKKLSYYTYKFLIEKFKGSDFAHIKTIATGIPNVYLYEFTKDSKSSYVVWWDYFDEPSGQTTKSVTLSLPNFAASSAKITDAIPTFEVDFQTPTKKLFEVDYPSFFRSSMRPIINRTLTLELSKKPMYVEDDSMLTYSGTVLAGTSALLLDFQKADYDAAVKSDKLIVLYFYANWCPICKAEFPIAQEAFNELATDNVIGFRVNYNDNETDPDEVALARQFGVAYQHTKVFVKNGQRILKSPEGWDDKRYDMEINKALTQ